VSSFAQLAGFLGRRLADTGLEGLQLFRPVDYLDEFAQQFGSGAPSARLVTASPRQIEEVGNWYAGAPSSDPAAEAAYRMMADETARQFDQLTSPVSRGGLGVDVSVSDVDPYNVSTLEGVRRLVEDMNNRKLAVLSTQTTGGHPFFTNDQNDMFRAVHDAFGHGATGRGFNRHGEEAAYRSHARMFSPEARGALASETRGQNAFVNRFGDFPEQKMVTLPPELAGLDTFDLSGDPRAMLLINALSNMKAVR
jgi:hypothetical protein